MADGAIKASVLLRLTSAQVEKARELYSKMECDAEMFDDQLTFVLAEDEQGLVLHHDESLDVGQAISYICGLLNLIDSDQQVPLEYAVTCSSPRAGAFGGGAVVISRAGVVAKFDSTDMLNRFTNPTAYCGVFELVSDAVDEIKQAPNPEERLIQIVAANVRVGEPGFAAEVLQRYADEL